MSHGSVHELTVNNKIVNKVQMMGIGQGYNEPPHQTHKQQEKAHGPWNHHTPQKQATSKKLRYQICRIKEQVQEIQKYNAQNVSS